jgi:hypothetical protein
MRRIKLQNATAGPTLMSISPATVGRVLADAEVRPHRVRGWLRRTDDAAFWPRTVKGLVRGGGRYWD